MKHSKEIHSEKEEADFELIIFKMAKRGAGRNQQEGRGRAQRVRSPRAAATTRVEGGMLTRSSKASPNKEKAIESTRKRMKRYIFVISLMTVQTRKGQEVNFVRFRHEFSGCPNGKHFSFQSRR